MTITVSDPWQGTIVYFELRSNMDIDPGLVVDHRTDLAEEFDELFLDSDPGLDFTGVDTVTNSFADECIAKLLLEMSLEESPDAERQQIKCS